MIARGVPVGEWSVDVSYGGAIYASLPASAAGLEVTPAHYGELVRVGREIKWALDASDVARHPTDDRLSGVYGTILYDDLPATAAGPRQRNVAIFADGEADRSPCGSGTSARLALLAADGRMPDGAVLTHDSIVGTTFTARVVETVDGGRRHRGRGHRLPHGRAPLRARPARPGRDRVRAAVSLPFLDPRVLAAHEGGRRAGGGAARRPRRRGRPAADGRRAAAGDAVGRGRARREARDGGRRGAAHPGRLRALRRRHARAGRPARRHRHDRRAHRRGVRARRPPSRGAPRAPGRVRPRPAGPRAHRGARRGDVRVVGRDPGRTAAFASEVGASPAGPRRSPTPT